MNSSARILPALVGALALTACQETSVQPMEAGAPGEVVDAKATPGVSQAGRINTQGQVVGWSSLGDARTPFLWTPRRANGPAGAMVNLGSLGGIAAEANGVNTQGQVVGVSSLSGEATSHAFLWSPKRSNATTGSMVDIGTLGGTWSAARQINTQGQVVGNSYTSGNVQHAFLWAPTNSNGATGTMVDLGTLGLSSDAYGINTQGQVVGRSVANDFAFHAFLWTPTTLNGTTGTMVDLGVGVGNAVNARGQVAGTNVVASGNAALWTPTTANGTAGAWTALGTLGGMVSVALDINTQGQVVGSSWRSDQNSRFEHAFLWTPTTANGTTGTMIDLGTLGGMSSVATGINTQGQVVGFSYPSDNANRHAFLWTPTTLNGTTGVMVDLGILRR